MRRDGMHPWRNARRALVVLAVLGGLGTMAAGCGSTSNTTSSAAAQPAATSASAAANDASHLTPVKLLVVPQAAAEPFFIGQQTGIYRKHGINLDIKTTGNFNLLISQVQSGQFQFMQNAPLEMIQAQAEGFKFYLMNVINGNSPTDGSGMVVKPSSGIKRPKDLDGKTVCVAAVNSIQTLIINTAITKDGGNPSTVKYEAVPFPAAVPALTSGRCDAGELAEPFFAQGLKAGLVKAFDP